MFKNKALQSVKQVDKRIERIKEIGTPSQGCINNTRKLLNMSMEQLGRTIDVTSQGVYALERREQEGTITLQKLRKVANALDMRLVYAFVPFESLEAFVEKKALQKARELVQRTTQTMVLEGQKVDDEGIEEQVTALAQELKMTLDGLLWE